MPPIFVVGAGRSGTTMIREALSQHRDVAAFEFEMNYLWRYGNTRLPHDLLVPEQHLTQGIVAHIQRAFAQERDRQGRPVVLDKTVANVMRLRYLQAVFPGAKVLHVIRDGRAVASSALKRWRAPQPPSYFAAKLRTIPLRSLPLVVARYGASKLRSVVRRRDYRQSWGPRWPGIDEAVRNLPLAQVCAQQWQVSVNAARMQGRQLAQNTFLEIRYEALVQSPEAQFDQIRQFFALPEDKTFASWVRENVDAQRRDKWRDSLTRDEASLVTDEIAPLLNELGYV